MQVRCSAMQVPRAFKRALVKSAPPLRTQQSPRTMANSRRSSTPLSALPGTPPSGAPAPAPMQPQSAPADSFVNNEQRQIVTGARQAMQNFPMPMSGNMPPPPQMQQQQYVGQMPAQQQAQQPEEFETQVHQDDGHDLDEGYYAAPQNEQQAPPPQQQQPAQPAPQQPAQQPWSDELKTGAAVVVAFIIASFVPVAGLLQRYGGPGAAAIATHAPVVIRALLAAVIVLLLRRVL